MCDNFLGFEKPPMMTEAESSSDCVLMTSLIHLSLYINEELFAFAASQKIGEEEREVVIVRFGQRKREREEEMKESSEIERKEKRKRTEAGGKVVN